MPQSHVLVTGAGGFIGHHLVTYLVNHGYRVRGADLRRPPYAPTRAHEFVIADLRKPEDCAGVVWGVEEVYHLAANMGGIGFIESHKADILHDNLLIDLNLLEAARKAGVRRVLYTSSACVYPVSKQRDSAVRGLREEDAYPAEPEDGYGWEKLTIEHQCRHYREEYGLATRVVRLHNIYGPLGAYDGGREKSPAAICRKVALAAAGGEIEVWGDGEQTRSYCYVDDCVEGLHRLMRSDFPGPVNIGTERLVSINQLIDIVSRIAGKRVRPRYDLTKPQGVRGRNSDSSLARRVLGWEPAVSLEEGLERTYRWIASEVKARARSAAAS